MAVQSETAVRHLATLYPCDSYEEAALSLSRAARRERRLSLPVGAVAERKTFPLRISKDLYATLERWAADEMRSVNAQIEYLLLDAVRGADRERKSPTESRG